VFQLLKEPKFDFMGRRNLLLVISLIVVLLSVGVIVVKGINLGIEFTGGTELQIKFAERPDIGQIRAALQAAGLDNQAVTTIGDPSENEVYIRMSGVSEDEEWDISKEVRDALRARMFPDLGEGTDLNIADEASLRRLLDGMPELGSTEAQTLAAAIAERHKEVAIFHSWDDIADIPGVTPEVLQYLEGHSVIGPVALRSQSYIGPAIGHELMNKAMFAVIGSLIGMLIYIWIRFQFQWGFAAVVALTHDTLIVLGLFALFGEEMSLPVVAAFLTLVGYSVNDTVVVFDRIRENLKTQRAESLEALINSSINQTLSRTIITSGLTWIVVACLYVFGGPALRPFSFVITVGVIVGTYSSIYIASPILVLWKQFLDRRLTAAGSAKGGARRARKVRRSNAG